MLVLGIDTCGPTGSVALGRTTALGVEILRQRELDGRSYSATLVTAVGDLLEQQGIGLVDIGCIVIVNGPGSFTGVRVGLSAAKGLAEGVGTPLIAVSRLVVLAHKAGLRSAALDAHRNELFLRREDGAEMLAGAEDLASLPAEPYIAVCDEAAISLLQAAQPDARLTRLEAPTAADALMAAARGIAAGEFTDVALLDGHYLRRSDAEIFGTPVLAAAIQSA